MIYLLRALNYFHLTTIFFVKAKPSSRLSVSCAVSPLMSEPATELVSSDVARITVESDNEPASVPASAAMSLSASCSSAACDQCGKVFNNTAGLVLHYLQDHRM